MANAPINSNTVQENNEAADKVLVEFDVKLKVSDMYRFSLYHTYTSSQGIIPVVMSCLVFIVAALTTGKIDIGYTVIYYICAVTFLLYQPILCYVQSKVQLSKGTILSGTVHYIFSQEGIRAVSNEMASDNETFLLWEDVLKVRETGKEIFIFSDRSSAFIFPKDRKELPLLKINEVIWERLPREVIKLKNIK